MKKSLVILAAMAFVIAMVSGAFAAVTSQDVAVSAAVSKMCKLGSDGLLGFGTIDPSDTATVSASSTGLTYKCSSGTTFTITQLASAKGSTTGTCAGFTGTMKSTATPADALAYTVTCTAGGYAGAGFSTAIPVTIDGTITQAQYQDVVPHTDYTDTLTVTITY
jgi:spore coat protein U-like protein